MGIAYESIITVNIDIFLLLLQVFKIFFRVDSPRMDENKSFIMKRLKLKKFLSGVSVKID
jgi:hypothetical protein